MNLKPAPKKPRKPKQPAAPDERPLPVDQIMVSTTFSPRHACIFAVHNVPTAAWPSPSPVELATVAAACGWANQTDGAQKAMVLLWRCAEVIHQSQNSAADYVAKIRERSEWTHKELRKACGFDYWTLPDKITHADFFSRFNTAPLQVGGKPLRGKALFDHWQSLSDVPLDEAEAWHIRHKEGHEWPSWSFSERWDALGIMVGKFHEWRKKTALQNKSGTKNLKNGKKKPC